MECQEHDFKEKQGVMQAKGLSPSPPPASKATSDGAEPLAAPRFTQPSEKTGEVEPLATSMLRD